MRERLDDEVRRQVVDHVGQHPRRAGQLEQRPERVAGAEERLAGTTTPPRRPPRRRRTARRRRRSPTTGPVGPAEPGAPTRDVVRRRRATSTTDAGERHHPGRDAGHDRRTDRPRRPRRPSTAAPGRTTAAPAARRTNHAGRLDAGPAARRAPPPAPPAGAARSTARTRPPPAPRCDWASRLVRFETGSSRLAELASQTEANANGSTASPSSAASASPIGASSTAVVSMLSTQVHTVASSVNSRNSRSRLPPATRAATCALTSKSPASSHRSATTWISARNSRTGQTRSATSRRPVTPAD